MKTIDDINLYTWFMNRELDFTPDHFVLSKTSLTTASKEWIQEKLSGRFSLVSPSGTFLDQVPAFEDPKEALFYELTWG